MQAVPSRADPSRAPCAAKGALRSGSRVWLAALALAVLTVLAARPARAEDETVVAGMSQNRIAITADFDGSELLIQSRAMDEHGNVQPTKEMLRSVRGENSIYHNNGIQTWLVNSKGEAENVEVS